MKHSSLDRLAVLAFWALGVICLLELRDLAGMALNSSSVVRAVSALTLLCCVAALAPLLRSGPWEALGVPGALILSCFASYAGIGIVRMILDGAESGATPYLTNCLISMFVIVAAAGGGRAVCRRFGQDRLLQGVMIILAASCAVMLASPWLQEVLPNAPMVAEYRYFGSFANPNDAALVACFAIVTALAGLRVRLILAYAVLPLGVVAALGTASRTALLLIPVLLIISLCITRSEHWRRVACGVAGAAVVLAGAAMTIDVSALAEPRIDRWRTLGGVFAATSDPAAVSNRPALWEMGLDQALDSPLVGNGLGSFHHLDAAWYNESGVLLGVHNQYLLFLGEAGFLPLILFISFLVVTFFAGFRRATPWTFAAVAGYSAAVALFSLAFHNLFTELAINFIIGSSCAIMTSHRSGGRGRPGMTSAS